jgi:hypothetical protein
VAQKKEKNGSYLCGSGHDKCGIAEALALAMCPFLNSFYLSSLKKFFLSILVYQFLNAVYRRKKTNLADVCRSVSCITTFVISNAFFTIH